MGNPWHKKLSATSGPRPPSSWLIFCVTSILALITILGLYSSNASDPVTPTELPAFVSSHKSIREQAAVDYLNLRSLSLSENQQKELQLCGKDKENYVPCYNVSANLLAGLKDGEEFDRHCEVSRRGERCIIRPPKDYKIPLKWPLGKNIIWSGNVKITKEQFLSSGTMTKRLMLLEENQIAFHSEDGLMFEGVKDYSRQLAEMLELGSDSEFFQAGVRTVLDIGCGFGSFGAHLLSLNLMAICIAAYEATGSQVQLALERGLPAMIGNFISKQLPYPSLSFGMVHCAQCDISWHEKDGLLLLEVDRILKPGGFFVVTSPRRKTLSNTSGKKKQSILAPVGEFSEKICWSLIAQQEETFVWQKTADLRCYSSRKQSSVPLCKAEPGGVMYYQPLEPCISGTASGRWIPIQNTSTNSELSTWELELHGVQTDEYFEDLQLWKLALRNYWSLLTPLIFSDHPKRPGEEDPLPPYNMIRNVMDMNACYGNLNSAILEEGKSVWVMNVVPVDAKNTLPLILDRGFAGVVHDWCEPFPTYPRTYDLLHASGLLSGFAAERCSMMDLFVEMDRILRPEGWVVISDKLGAIEMARALAARTRWEARVIDLQNGSDQRLLVCQKQFMKN